MSRLMSRCTLKAPNYLHKQAQSHVELEKKPTRLLLQVEFSVRQEPSFSHDIKTNAVYTEHESTIIGILP
jgi:hypothetical protein